MPHFTQKFLISLVLFSCGFIVQKSFAVENASDIANAVIAHHGQKKTFIDKTIISEKHRRKQAQQRPVTKRLKKKMSQISHAQHDKISSIIVTGNKSIKTEKIKSLIRPYLGGRVTKKEAERITTDIENYYRQQGYFLPVAHIEIDESLLRVRTIEGKIKSVIVGFANEKRDKKVLKNQIFLNLIGKIENANPLKTKDLEKYLILINKIHGYTVHYEIKPLPQIEGDNVAELIMQVETKRGTASISVNNAGTNDLGKHQFSLSAQAYNVISNDSLMLTLGTSEKPKKFQVITAGYLKRLSSYGTSASVFVSHLKDDPYDTAGSEDSISNIIKGRIDQYLILNNDHTFKLEISAEHRDVTNYSQNLKTSDYEYVMGSVGGKIKLTDPLGVENWFFPYFHGTLNEVSYKGDSIEPRNFDRDFNYFVIDWYRNQPLPKNFSLFLKASYQHTDKLLPSEHVYSINASNTARGYTSGLVSSDQGISGISELRYTKEFKQDNIKKFLQTAQIFGFYDITHFIKHNETANRTKHPGVIYFNKSTFSAFGAGLRLFFPYEFFAEGTAEFPTIKNVSINGVNNRNRAIYRFVISKEFDW